MLSYLYRPLQRSNPIRILVLHPSSNLSDPVLCTIQHARLEDESLKYEALSYTWGDATQKRKIYLNNGSRELYVTENCHNALRYLRNKHEPRLLWVDAICINQEDLKERARQVCMMNEIFEYAFTVVVFLGEPTPQNGILFEELVAADKALSRLGHCNRQPPSRVIIELLEELFQNPWFKRVWVLQEVCAKESVTFLCGATSFSYRSLLALYTGYQDSVVTTGYWPLTTQWIIHPPEQFSTPEFNLWNRLGESRDYLATDPKDRVFALKSLIGGEQSQMDHLIDYTASIEECFTDIATFLLPVLGLRLLTAARHPHRKKMSSWIPDWSQTLPLQIWSFLVEFPKSYEPASYVDAPENQRYEIRPYLGKDRETRLELRVTGCRCAQVVKSSQVFQFTSGEDAKRQMKKLYYSLDNLRHFVDKEAKTSDDPTMYLHLEEAILRAMTSMSDRDLDLHLRRGSAYFEPYDFFSSQDMMQDLVSSLQNCKICLMDDGGLAIVPEAARPGDLICALSGAISPCALRPSSNETWTLISGDCYIFTDDYRARETEFFLCDDFVAYNDHMAEEFVIR